MSNRWEKLIKDFGIKALIVERVESKFLNLKNIF